VSGTVFDGPGLPPDNPWADKGFEGNEMAPPKATAPQTIYDDNAFVRQSIDEAAVSATARHCARWASLRFFIVTTMALIETLVWLGVGNTLLAFASAMVTGTFALLGVIAFRMNRTAFLIGASVYAAETLCLLSRWSPSMFLPVVVHAVIVWRLYCMYSVLQDLEAV
jgi:hypothetical protein